MSFDYPFALAGFLVFIPVIFYDIFTDSRKFRHKLPKYLQKKLKISTVFFRLFLAFSIIALSGPRWGTEISYSEYRRGLDLVYAIDVSRSMDIRDAQGMTQTATRLERAIEIAGESAQAAYGARFAAVIGRSMGYLAVPLTYDNEAFLRFIESLDGFTVTGRSTNLESLIQTASESFQVSSPAKKVIVFLSDGEAHFGSLTSALNLCVNNGITVIAVGIGSDEGRPVPQTDSAVSRRDTFVMRMAAERTGGIYIDGSREDASSVISSHLLSLAHQTNIGSGKPQPKQQRTFFIILAVIAYSISKFVPLLPSGAHMLFAVIIILPVFLSCSEGKLLIIEANYLNSRGRYNEALVPYLKALNHEDAAPYAEYGLGQAFYSLDESAAALNRYVNSQKMLETASSGEHRELRFRNYYNSGIIFFDEGEYQAAAAAFREALKIDPRKIEAKRNLELSLLSITMESNREKQTETRQEAREIIFDYLKQQEQQHWRSREWAPPEENYAGKDW
jgi:Ca-activated chloride channel family protein